MAAKAVFANAKKAARRREKSMAIADPRWEDVSKIVRDEGKGRPFSGGQTADATGVALLARDPRRSPRHTPSSKRGMAMQHGSNKLLSVKKKKETEYW